MFLVRMMQQRCFRDAVILLIAVVFAASLYPGSADSQTSAVNDTKENPPAETAGFALAPIRLDATQRQEIGLTYGVVERRAVEHVIRTVGRFDYDERKMAEVTLKVGGYIQDL